MSDLTQAEKPIGDLIVAIRAGDDDAVGEVMERYRPFLHRVLRVRGVIRSLQSHVESQDLVQSAFVHVVAAIRGGKAEFRDEAGFQGFLKTTGRNRLRDHIRRMRAAKRDGQRTLRGNAEALAQLPTAAPGPDHVAEVREQIARVEAFTAPADLEVMWERADGKEWQELAAKRNTSPEALRKRIARVHQRLRECESLKAADG